VLVEVFARAVVNLCLLVLPSKKVEVEDIEEGSLRQCLHKWGEEKAVTVHRITIEDSENSFEVFCDKQSLSKIEEYDEEVIDFEFERFEKVEYRNPIGKEEAHRCVKLFDHSNSKPFLNRFILHILFLNQTHGGTLFSPTILIVFLF